MRYDVYHMNAVKSNGNSGHVIDAFICFNTQEERAFCAFNQLLNQNRLCSVLVLKFNKENCRLENNASNICISYVEVDDDLSTSIIHALQEIEKFISDKNMVGIDISSMPIPFMAQILHFFYKRHNNTPLAVYYSEPSHYTLKNLFDYSAYGGEIDVKAIPGFEGETSRADENKRVVFYIMGFETKYLNDLIPQDVNPNEITPINGFPSYFPKYKDISLINGNINFYEQDIEIIYVEANNPFQTYNTMVSLSERYTDFSIDIIPVGTKPMALGACMFALKNRNSNCRMIFPYPTEYNPNQNTGYGVIWEYILQQ